MENKGKKISLNIVSSKVNHKGFGAGAIDLSNVSGVVIDQGEAYLDNGTLHAKSKIEKGIKFSGEKEDVPNGRRCFIVWVAVDRDEEGQFYGGLAACEMLVDTEAKRGWKILADHVNRMDRAMKRKILVENLNDSEKMALKKLLSEFNPEWWAHTPEEVKKALEE
ncbi:YwhD family protein [Gorillibacterium massiliense]|uniref:YwhD family protein n=1 Tax=Gorillibacterium massiliense TaxID=1280390 RepID=UPI0009DFA881|nr:YwhD family protein [Gorillibacterium massiliense]